MIHPDNREAMNMFEDAFEGILRIGEEATGVKIIRVDDATIFRIDSFPEDIMNVERRNFNANREKGEIICPRGYKVHLSDSNILDIFIDALKRCDTKGCCGCGFK